MLHKTQTPRHLVEGLSLKNKDNSRASGDMHMHTQLITSFKRSLSRQITFEN